MLMLAGVIGPWLGWWGSECTTALAQTGDQGATRICGPVGITDYRVISVGLVALALIAPDLAEVSVGGVALKRLIVDSATKSDAKIESVGDAVQRLEIRLSQEQVQHNTTVVSNVVDEAELGRLVRHELDSLPGGLSPSSESDLEDGNPTHLFLLARAKADAVALWTDRETQRAERIVKASLCLDDLRTAEVVLASTRTSILGRTATLAEVSRSRIQLEMLQSGYRELLVQSGQVESMIFGGAKFDPAILRDIAVSFDSYVERAMVLVFGDGSS